MKPKYEIVKIGMAAITVDISLLSKTEEMFFNATDMAKPFGKSPKDFLKIGPTKEYIEEIFKEDLNPIKSLDDLIRIVRGKFGGTWFHQELAFEFAGWCSPLFYMKHHSPEIHISTSAMSFSSFLSEFILHCLVCIKTSFLLRLN